MTKQTAEMIWTYWDNSKQWHGSIFFQTKAKTITEADENFLKEKGISPGDKSTIGVTVSQDPVGAL